MISDTSLMRTWNTSSGYKIIRILAGRSNVFLLNYRNKNILIDTSPESRRKQLDNRLKMMDIDHIDYLILTHTHYDHAGNAAWIKEKYMAQVILHKTEAKCLASGKNILPQGTNFFSGTLVKLFAKPFLRLSGYDPCKHDILVDSLFDLKETGFNGNIMHTPGHTEGSLSVIIDNEIALAGDTLFGIFRNSVFPPFADDINKLVKSWGDLLKTGCSVFIPSHGSAITRELLQKEYDRRVTSK